MDLIFRVNISSAGDKPALVFGLGVILYTDRKISRLFSSVSMPWFFFKALLNVSTNLSARPFDLEWYIAVVKCSMDKGLAEFFKLFAGKLGAVVTDNSFRHSKTTEEKS